MSDEKEIKIILIFRSKKGRKMGGAETSMYRLIRELSKQNFSIKVFFYGYTIEGFDSKLFEIGVENRLINNIFHLFSDLKKESPDIVYLFSRIHAFFWGVCAKLLKVPIILLAERGASNSIIDKISSVINMIIVNGIISNSSASSKNIIKLGFPPSKIFVVKNGVDANEIIKLMKENVDFDNFNSPSLICIGNIRPIKGHIYLLLAIKKLQNKYPELKVILIGNDNTNGKFFSDVNRKGLKNTYIWLGYKENIYPYLKNSDIFILPSLSEGAPTSIIEAMYVGVPVISTNVGGVSELIENKVTGYLVPPNNDIALAEAIDFLITNIDIRNEIINNAKNYVYENHSINHMVEGHINAFTNLMKSRNY